MRRIKKARVTHLSLCPKGANRLPVMLKDDSAFDLLTLSKAATDFETNHEIHAVVYAPGLRDTDGEWANAATIKEMAHQFGKVGEGIDLRHDFKTLDKDAAFVAESFIIQKGDPRFADMKTYDGQPVDVAGGWGVVLKIDSEDLRKQYAEGKWAGISMGGTYELEAAKAGDENAVLNFFKQILGFSKQSSTNAPSGVHDMDKTETLALIDAGNKTVLDTIKGMFKSAGLNVEADATPGAKTKGGPSKPVCKNFGDPKLVAKYKDELRRFNLSKDVDWEDPDSIEVYEAALAKLDEDAEGNEGEDLDTNGQPVKKDAGSTDSGKKAKPGTALAKAEQELALARQRLAKLQRNSNTPSGAADEGEGGGPSNNGRRGKAQQDTPVECGVVGTMLKEEDANDLQDGANFATSMNNKRFGGPSANN